VFRKWGPEFYTSASFSRRARASFEAVCDLLGPEQPGYSNREVEYQDDDDDFPGDENGKTLSEVVRSSYSPAVEGRGVAVLRAPPLLCLFFPPSLSYLCPLLRTTARTLR
jgi:hypothetical protein